MNCCCVPVMPSQPPPSPPPSMPPPLLSPLPTPLPLPPLPHPNTPTPSTTSLAPSSLPLRPPPLPPCLVSRLRFQLVVRPNCVCRVQLHIITPLCEGGNLLTHVVYGYGLEERIVRKWARQILLGLAYIHSKVGYGIYRTPEVAQMFSTFVGGCTYYSTNWLGL